MDGSVAGGSVACVVGSVAGGSVDCVDGAVAWEGVADSVAGSTVGSSEMAGAQLHSSRQKIKLSNKVFFMVVTSIRKTHG